MPGKGQQAAPKQNVLIVSHGNKEILTGQGAFFLRTQTKLVTAQNIHNEICFGPLQPDILTALTTLVKHVIQPALVAQDSWGIIHSNKDASVLAFLEGLTKFTTELDVAVVNLRECVVLNKCTVNLDAYKRPIEYVPRPPKANFKVNAAHNPEVVSGLEALVSEWCKQIEQVLAESEQMRKEADDIGPNAELAHWKARMVKFNSITDQIKTPGCKKVIGILNAIKSRALMTAWKDLDDRVTDAANESKDNVKYLYTLERFCEPLYRSDPMGMIPSIPGMAAPCF